ncbi:MAG: hypothetical protein HOO92_07545 [Methylococcaceae bacterium]|nr:hypothetical protein [Methylococcaceae bacterium]
MIASYWWRGRDMISSPDTYGTDTNIEVSFVTETSRSFSMVFRDLNVAKWPLDAVTKDCFGDLPFQKSGYADWPV